MCVKHYSHIFPDILSQLHLYHTRLRPMGPPTQAWELWAHPPLSRTQTEISSSNVRRPPSPLLRNRGPKVFSLEFDLDVDMG